MLTYRARKRSDKTLESIRKYTDEKLKSIPEFEEGPDIGILNGYTSAKIAIDALGLQDKAKFKNYFLHNVHIIHYKVPKDIDLNHYFEIMNSRGEQLEKHEIVKANLMEKLGDGNEQKKFNRIWESCAEMSVYVQQNFENVGVAEIFGNNLHDFIPENFAELANKIIVSDNEVQGTKTIAEIIRSQKNQSWDQKKVDGVRKDSFLPIIDFPNFLLIVLKLTRMEESDFSPEKFNLDDKELLNEFRAADMGEEKVRRFAFNLLKARFYLDNYIVHHSMEEDTIESNPWKLQVWQKDEDTKKGQLRNLSEDESIQEKLAQLLSMFEVSFTARQRKNYLFYCLFFLMKDKTKNISVYSKFVEDLADRYFYHVYLDDTKLNEKNTPRPGSFDEVMLDGNKLSESDLVIKPKTKFNDIYGDGKTISKGIPLYVFNYLDYKLWEMYDSELRGEKLKENSIERLIFFAKLGCSDFGLKVFDQFYFSRTRRSLEHYYAQATATGIDGALDQNQINCFGNYAMIGSEANSSGSNWSPKTKLDHYLDPSRKTDRVSVASLKFMIMMQICRDNSNKNDIDAWNFEDIRNHQDKMIDVMMGDKTTENALRPGSNSAG